MLCAQRLLLLLCSAGTHSRSGVPTSCPAGSLLDVPHLRPLPGARETKEEWNHRRCASLKSVTSGAHTAGLARKPSRCTARDEALKTAQRRKIYSCFLVCLVFFFIPLKLDFVSSTLGAFLKECLISKSLGRTILCHFDLREAELSLGGGGGWSKAERGLQCISEQGRTSRQLCGMRLWFMCMRMGLRLWGLCVLPRRAGSGPIPQPRCHPLSCGTQSEALDYLHFHMESDVSPFNAWPVILFTTLQRAGAKPTGDINYSSHLTLCVHA